MVRHVSPCVAAFATLALLVPAGCTPSVALPTSPSASPTPSTVSPSPTASPTALDLTRPGEARRMFDQLLTAAGPGRLIMAEATEHTASVSVLPPDSTEPVTWAYRDGKVQQVESDLQYVDQASFQLDSFDISDLGRLFRVAAAVAGSTQNQTLQIVDYSGGRVVMAVTTNPESRTVFFNPDGGLLPTLDYHAPSGIAQGIAAVVADRATVQAMGVDSATGAWVDYTDSGSIIRRQRPAKVPVTVLKRVGTSPLRPFATNRVQPDVIWRVLQRTLAAEGIDRNADWSVTIDDRRGVGAPRMYFTIGTKSLVTSLTGEEITPG